MKIVVFRLQTIRRQEDAAAITRVLTSRFFPSERHTCAAGVYPLPRDAIVVLQAKSVGHGRTAAACR